jgi:hypothetical protein
VHVIEIYRIGVRKSPAMIRGVVDGLVQCNSFFVQLSTKERGKMNMVGVDRSHKVC